MDIPNTLCTILEYQLNLENNTDSGIEQLEKNCSSSKDCQTIRIDTSSLKNYIFSYAAVSNAHTSFNILRSQDYNVSVTCGAETLTVIGETQIEIKLEQTLVDLERKIKLE